MQVVTRGSACGRPLSDGETVVGRPIAGYALEFKTGAHDGKLICGNHTAYISAAKKKPALLRASISYR